MNLSKLFRTRVFQWERSVHVARIPLKCTCSELSDLVYCSICSQFATLTLHMTYFNAFRVSGSTTRLGQFSLVRYERCFICRGARPNTEHAEAIYRIRQLAPASAALRDGEQSVVGRVKRLIKRDSRCMESTARE